MIILTLAMEVFAVLFIVLFVKKPYIDVGYLEGESTITSLLGVVTIFILIVSLCISYLSVMKRRWQEDDEEEIESYSRRLKRAIVSDELKQDINNKNVQKESKKEIDALGRMLINLEDIKEFYTWSQKQAKASFILAVAMCVLSFALMVVALILPVVFRLSFQMSTIPAIGGAITEIIEGRR